MDQDTGYSSAYPIMLWARSPIVLDEAALSAALGARLGRVKAGRNEAKSSPGLYFLEDYPVQFKEGSIPAQLALIAAEAKAPKGDRHPSVEQAMQQSWAFPGAREVLDACRFNLMLGNMMSSPLPHEVRRKIIANGLLAVLESTAVDLIAWLPTQQMLAPADVRQRYAEPQELANPVYGFLNVRFFKISNSDGDVVMDTLGLTDFQIHYRQLEPDPVARLLHNLGHKIEHIETIDPAEVARFAKLGVIASLQPAHAGGMNNPNRSSTRWINIGYERSAWGFPWKSIAEAGGHVALGSDWPVASLNPGRGMFVALNRMSNPPIPDQKLTMTELIDGYTREGAYTIFEEQRKGTLAPGMLADIVILADDVFTNPPQAAGDLVVQTTVFDGKVVYQRRTDNTATGQ